MLKMLLRLKIIFLHLIHKPLKSWKREIDAYSKKLEFEKAAEARDKIKRINMIQEEQSITTKAKDVDIFQ